jgi:hypothetical protein
MSDSEVARLRRLRSCALRVRATALALATIRCVSNDSLLLRAAGSSWRIARTVSGRLKAHPYARYQKDVTVGWLLRNAALAKWTAHTKRNRMQVLLECESQLRQLVRQLDDARALTWLPDLSDAFGRYQTEIKALMAELAHETRSVTLERLPKRAAGVAPHGAGDLAPPMATDWPYLAF